MSRLTEDLLRWYDTERRILPWREEPGPYRTWISEAMLQQTQVATVLPYFERFMSELPTVNALASAPVETVLGLWAGLRPNIARTFLVNAAELGTYDQAKVPQPQRQLLLPLHGAPNTQLLAQSSPSHTPSFSRACWSRRSAPALSSTSAPAASLAWPPP